MKKEADYRLNHILHKGDQIRTNHAVYTISGEPLGLGGSSILYPAIKEGSKLEVAIKEWFPRLPASFERRNGIIQPKDPNDTVTHKVNRELFKTELARGEDIRNATVRAIHLWGILKPTEIIISGKKEDGSDVANGLFAVMERMDKKGKSFNQLLKYIGEKPSDGHPLKTKGLPRIHTTALIMKQVLTALQKVHKAPEHGFVFGDIQDGNLYFADCELEQGNIGIGMLLDFGCTKPLKLVGEENVYEFQGENMFSSPGYIPPEIADPEAYKFKLTERADIFSAGCLMLRMLLHPAKITTLGNTPHYRENLVDEVDAAKIGCSESNRRLVMEILKKALSPNPGDRPSVDEMLEDIQKLITDTAPPTYLLPKAPGSSESFVEGSRKTEIDNTMRSLEVNKPAFLWGCPGIGKSEIAIQVAKEFEKRSPKGSYFIHYTVPANENQEAMEETVLRMPFEGYKYEPERSGMSLEEQRKADYRKRINILQKQYAGALLVIDNFDWLGKTLDDLKGEKSYLELESIGLNLLFTTRNEVPGTPEVKELSREDLLKLMRRWVTDPRITDQQLYDLIEAVDGHTLTVDIMAKTLEESWGDVTPEMMLESFRKSKLSEDKYPEVTHRALAKGEDPERIGHRDPKTAKIYEHLKALFDLTGMSTADKTVLCCATLLPDGGMDAQLFRSCLDTKEKERLIKLVKCGWLSRPERILKIHPIVREVCRGELKPDDEACESFLNSLWNQYDEKEYDHIRYHQMADCFAVASYTLPEHRGTWEVNAEYLYEEIGYHKKGLALAEKLKTLREESTSDDSWKETLRHIRPPKEYTNPVQLYIHEALINDLLGNYEKELECQLNAMEILEKEHSQDNPSLLELYSNVARTYNLLDNYEKELEYLLKAIEILEKMHHQDSSDLLELYNNAACAYDLLDNYEKELEYQLKAIEILEKIHPQDNPDLLELYYEVACTYDLLSNYEKGLEYLLKAIEILEKKYPQNNPDLLKLYHGVASAYDDLGNHEKEVEYRLKIVEKYEKEKSSDHPKLAKAYEALGSAYASAGDYEKTLEYQLKAMEILKKKLPSDHPDLIFSYCSVATAYFLLGNPEKGKDYLQKSTLAERENQSRAVSG